MANRHQNYGGIEDRIYEGYAYLVHIRRNDIIYLRCRNYLNHFCRGRGRIIGGIFEPLTGHNHAPEPNLNIIDHFLSDLQEACRTQFRSPQVIYNLISIMHQEAALLYPMIRVLPRMRYWQRNRNLPAVESIIQLYETINQPGYGQLMSHGNSEIHFQLTRIEEVNEIVGITFSDQQLSSRITTNNQSLFISTNHFDVPHGINVAQNLAVIVQHGNYCFPLGFSFLSNTEQLTYRGIIRRMLDTADENFVPHKVFYNFNNNVYQTLKNLFNEETVIKGTFSSHCQIILEKAAMLNIQLNNDNLIFIKKLISLSLLPSNRIVEAFTLLKETVPAEMIEMVQLFQYYHDSWIISVNPENFSFYEDQDALLNCQDAHWKMIDSFLFNRNRNIWSFLEVYYKYYTQCYSSLNRIADRRQIYGIPRARPIINPSTISRLWKLINDHDIDISNFLDSTTALLEQYINDSIFNGIFPDINFVVAIYNEVEEVTNVDDDLALMRRDRLIREGCFVTGDGRCLGCMVAIIEIEFLPCKHVVICEACLKKMQETAARRGAPLKCAVCRAIPVDVRRVE